MKEAMIIKPVLVALLVFGAQAFCAEEEVMRMELRANQTYKDADVNCFGASARGQILFSAKIEEGVVIEASLENFPHEWPYLSIYQSLKLSEDEIKSIKLFKDSRGIWWLTRLSLSEPSLKWALYEAGNHYSFCPLPQPLATVVPSGSTFEFETEGLQEGIWISESNQASVTGTRKDGGLFSGGIQFSQKEIPSWKSTTGP